MKPQQIRELFWLFLIAVFISAWGVAMREVSHWRNRAEQFQTALEAEGYVVREDSGELVVSRDGREVRTP
jgi:hypothetical protein